MKTLAARDLDVFLDRHGRAELAWSCRIEIPGDPEFPTLRLPPTRLRYSTERSYPFAFEARLAGGQPLLFANISSFETAIGTPSGWAIPAAYTPRDEDQRLRQLLGFDEGWEDAEYECMFVCDARFAELWRAALERGCFGLTVAGAASLYPVRLGDREREPLAAFLAALARTAKPKPAARKSAVPSRARGPTTKPAAKKKTAAAKKKPAAKKRR
jgi:hypothetical protein